MAQNTLERVQEIARTVFGSNDIVLTEETTAADVDGWDSISHMQLIMSVEKAFGMRFSASDLAGLANVGDLLEVVAAKAKH
ncbi:acyl carrier protein [bacterium]|nr:acyl carrier protein [bacterium]